jgi:tetratricopeptide (TPR) repeat protein
MTLATLLTVASGRPIALAQENNDPVKNEIWRRFVDNRGPHQEIAYQAAQEYLQKYSTDNDKYTKYVQKWIPLYEREERKRILPILISQKNFSEAFRVGSKILADAPNYLPALIALGYAGYLAALNKNETHNADALAYARKAIELLESGRKPYKWALPKGIEDWASFKGKEDTLAHLNYAKGFLTLKINPEESIDAFIKAASYDSDIRRKSSTYYLLAVAYENGPYKTQSAAYQHIYASKPEGPESKATFEKLQVIVDRIIDAYARAIFTAGEDPETEQSRKEWLGQMTTYYKFRHGTDAGLHEFIAGSMRSSLPLKP